MQGRGELPGELPLEDRGVLEVLEVSDPEGLELEVCWLISKKRSASKAYFDWGKCCLRPEISWQQLLSWELVFKVKFVFTHWHAVIRTHFSLVLCGNFFDVKWQIMFSILLYFCFRCPSWHNIEFDFDVMCFLSMYITSKFSMLCFRHCGHRTFDVRYFQL